jgi:hypothetical protein
MFKKILIKGFDLKEDYRYPFFLICLGTFLFIPSLVGLSDVEFIENVLFVIFILSSLTLIEAESKLVRSFTYIIGIIGIFSEIYHKFIHPLGYASQVVFVILIFIYFILLTIELLNQIFTAKKITINVVLGAFTGYIMIGIIGYFIFRLVFLLDPSAFAIPANATQELIYFTFITLTTIGYGDISPISEAARNFAIILGLVGQFYNHYFFGSNSL